MLRNLYFILALAVTAAMPGIGSRAETAFRAGAAVADITPRQFPINMPGGFSANTARSAHDPLHARALILDDGRIALAMVVIDNLGAGPEVLDEAKQIAASKTGLSVDKMLISSTHTHSG